MIIIIVFVFVIYNTYWHTYDTYGCSVEYFAFGTLCSIAITKCHDVDIFFVLYPHAFILAGVNRYSPLLKKSFILKMAIAFK